MRLRLLLILALLPCLLPPAQAGILFGRKKDKVDPRTRVPELVATLKADGDADKRALAADELRYYDPAAYPEILPALVHALHHDPKPAVRLEALQSLGKIRPVTQAAGDALEQALANDASMRVRLQARSTLLQYHWAGYRSGKKTDVPPLPSKEPPLAGPDLPPAIQTTRPTDRLPAVAPPAPAPVALPVPPPPATGLRGLFGFRSTPTPPATPATRPSTAEPPLAAPVPAPAPTGPPLAPPAPPVAPVLAPPTIPAVPTLAPPAAPAGPVSGPPIPLPPATPPPTSSNEGPELN